MSRDPAAATPAELIGRCLDGPSDPAAERELARRIAADPALGRQLRQHLRIAELAHHRAAAERGGAAFAAAWTVRVAAEADAAVFTARTMMRIVGERADRRAELVLAGIRLGGLAAAACLVLGLGWCASALVDLGRRWFDGPGAVRLEGTAYAQRGAELHRLVEGQR